jgi:hypothetical protein
MKFLTQTVIENAILGKCPNYEINRNAKYVSFSYKFHSLSWKTLSSSLTYPPASSSRCVLQKQVPVTASKTIQSLGNHFPAFRPLRLKIRSTLVHLPLPIPIRIYFISSVMLQFQLYYSYFSIILLANRIHATKNLKVLISAAYDFIPSP